MGGRQEREIWGEAGEGERRVKKARRWRRGVLDNGLVRSTVSCEIHDLLYAGDLQLKCVEVTIAEVPASNVIYVVSYRTIPVIEIIDVNLAGIIGGEEEN